MSGPQPVRLTRAVEFSTSLRYRRPDLSEADNRRLFGPASRQHGHNFRLEVTVEGEPDPRTGMVMDLTELKAVLEAEVMDRFDHRDLNADTPFFEKRVATPENLALVIHQLLREALPPGSLSRIRLQADEDSWVEVVEERPQP